MVHGFPDTQQVWSSVARHLQADFTVVTYDVRGAGRSTAPARPDGYRRERLVDDLVAVLDATVPTGPVHLVGHDWGSVQLWEAVLTEAQDPRLRGRLASFTSISGPPLDLFAHYFRHHLRRRRLRRVADQARRSWYVGAFQVPLLPELLMTTGPGPGVARTVIERLERVEFGPTFSTDVRHGINLYRQNLGLPSGPLRHTSVPVQLLVPRHDRFLSPALYEDLPAMAPRLTRRDLDAGHWVVVHRAEDVAQAVAEHVRTHA
jgi:pimeloyl-ACP methyl ester carboxylesterase